MRQRSLTTSNMRAIPPLASKVDLYPLNTDGNTQEVVTATNRCRSISARSRSISDSKIALPPITERQTRSTSQITNKSESGTGCTNVPKSRKLSYQRQTSLPEIKRSAREIRTRVVPESDTLWTYVFDSLRLPCLFSQEASFETLSRQTDFIKGMLKHYDTSKRLWQLQEED